MPNALNWQPKSWAAALALQEKQNELDRITQEISTPAPIPEQPIEQPSTQSWQPEMNVIQPDFTPRTSWQSEVSELSPIVNKQPSLYTSLPESIQTPTIPQVAATQAPQTAQVPDKYAKELDPLHPFKIDSELPLWAKALNFVGKPFELIQEYLFDPLLAAVHTPFSKSNLDAKELAQAKQEGIASYFPGGIRHQSYEELQYAAKWAVEMLPWLVVPPIGMVGKVGQAGKGIAGALGKTGKVGELAGKALEYSPAGLTEKALGGVIGKLSGKAASATQKPLQTIADPKVEKVVNSLYNMQAKRPEQKLMTHELRQKQFAAGWDAYHKAGGGEAGAIAQARAMGVIGDKVQIQGIRNQLTNQEINDLYSGIAKHFESKTFKRGNKVYTGAFSKPANDALRIALDGGNIPPASEVKALAEVYPEIAQALVNTEKQSITNAIIETGNMFRATLASGDMSFPLRQGFILMARHPSKIPAVVGRMFKTVYSDKNAEILDEAIRGRKWTSIADQLVGEKGTKLELTALPSQYSKLPISAREESAASKWIQNVPLLGSIVKGSNRAYISAANDVRSLSWESTVEAWQKLSGKLTPTERDYSELAKFINAAAGRGELPKVLRGSSNLLNATLFSPKLFFSRIQTALAPFPKVGSSSALVRKEAARTLVQFMGAGMSLLGVAHIAGAKVNITDPRSSDFGKIVIGNTRLDLWTGYSQWARFIAQLSTAQRTTASGNVVDYNRAEVVQRFMQSKGSPLTSLMYDILRGESYSGEEVNLDTDNIKRQAWNRIAPLFLQDVLDAMEQEGIVQGGLSALPGAFGAGIITYVSPSQKMREQLAKDKYGMTWEQVGTDPKLGYVAQQQLERSDPKLLALIQKENEDYDKTITGKSDINNIYRNHTATIENLYKSKIDLAAQEYRDTGNGFIFKEKLNDYAKERRANYDVLNKDKQFAEIVARYDELPTAADLKKMSPQDWARKEYMRMMYSQDMYDQYGNYRFDVVDKMRGQFTQTYGQEMVDYIETYQGIKEQDMPEEYKQFKLAQKVLAPYWQVQDWAIENYGKAWAESNRGQAFISKIRKNMKKINPEIAKWYAMFYDQSQG